jgi:hypothetical protein
VVHFSGHSLAYGLGLERDDGTADLVPTPELVGLLRPARQRSKLVTLSSYLSAAGTAAAARRVLSLDVPDELEDEANQAAMQAPLSGLPDLPLSGCYWYAGSQVKSGSGAGCRHGCVGLSLSAVMSGKFVQGS